MGLSFATIRRGDVSDNVKFAQMMAKDSLMGIPSYQTAYYDMQVDGVFGEKTESAIKAVQKQSGLTVDGICGANTWNYLAPNVTSWYNKWNKKVMVEKVQTILFHKGYLDQWSDVDGVFGVETELAVKRFQSRYNLTQDGQWGKKCWSKHYEITYQ